ncbi:pyridoxamine 5'-phosphate oxidase family protein [Geobacter hydrogenophilus]|uniref:Pyridoxamine 5'-phosphate oxidase n=1 Tax=Geobacter hydrogenophilus TaxID=40983 RepID=A0A9W6LDV2_9BACT|nr:pyridoxamine 5'-phosphate oxidase family protein [Geobacter hydrogenophilus]MBT0894499.1 pyridoxamine 5'-phosphate oxidase family protein [Geobacter hydrogenophilus]GLI39345.1 pyridoxamine 5'-phosphate oxidase [Geobacter hydrogenophilus]
MKEVLEMLAVPCFGNLATVDGGKPRVRPFAFMYEENGRFYFCTASNKEVYRQLTETPFIEFTRTTDDMRWLRIGGEITFDEDIRSKEKCFANYPMLKDIYQSPDNPLFKVFYLEHGAASVNSLAGPPKTFEF